MTIDKLIEMRGGIVNYIMHKEIKGSQGKEFEEDVEKIWQVVKTYPEYWNPFSDFLKTYLIPDGNLQVSKRAKKVIDALAESSNKLNSVGKLNEIIDALEDVGVLQDVVHSDGKYRFRFKNEEIKQCLWEGGSILELHTYQKELNDSDECQVGVHLDWDGVVHAQSGR